MSPVRRRQGCCGQWIRESIICVWIWLQHCTGSTCKNQRAAIIHITAIITKNNLSLHNAHVQWTIHAISANPSKYQIQLMPILWDARYNDSLTWNKILDLEILQKCLAHLQRTPEGRLYPSKSKVFTAAPCNANQQSGNPNLISQWNKKSNI